MAVTNNCGLGCLLYKGGVIKSANHRYNQKIAAIMSRQTKGGTEKFKPTEEYYAVTQRRNNVIKDYMLQTGKHFITWCVENRIDTIVLGDNQFWKQNIRMGVVNNQNFVQIPFDQMKKILTYQAERRGIRLIRQEESYTSKANFLGQDDIPVYGGMMKMSDLQAHGSIGDCIKQMPVLYSMPTLTDPLISCGNVYLMRSDHTNLRIIRSLWSDIRCMKLLKKTETDR